MTPAAMKSTTSASGRRNVITLVNAAGVEVEQEIAGLGSRSVAYIIDWHVRLLLVFGWLLLVWVLAGGGISSDAMSSIFEREVAGKVVFYVGLIPSLIIYFFYHPLLEIVMKGRTPGKRWMKIRVVADNGLTASAGAILIRNVFRLVDSLPAYYMLGLLVGMVNQRNCRIGDLAAGTVLVFEKRSKGLDWVPGQNHSGIDPRDLDLVHELLERWRGLGREARTELAMRLLQKLGRPVPDELQLKARDVALRKSLQDLISNGGGHTPVDADAASHAISTWLQQHEERWKHIDQLVTRQKGRRDSNDGEVRELVSAFRTLSRHLSLARRSLPGSRIARYLEILFARCYDTIYQNPVYVWGEIVRLFRYDIPQAMYELRRPIIFSTTIFVVSAAIGWWLVDTYPELASLFASENMINEVQQGRLWTDDLLNIVPSSVLSFQIMTNNISVTIMAFLAGILYGFGTLYILGLNGLMLGGIFAFTNHYGMAHRLFEFVVAHGMVELSVIVLAGAAGMKMGEALIRPGNQTRQEAFRRAVGVAGKLVAVGAPLLVGAGIIEGYVSPNPEFSLEQRVLIGSAYWIFMVLLLSGRLWSLGRRAPVTRLEHG